MDFLGKLPRNYAALKTASPRIDRILRQNFSERIWISQIFDRWVRFTHSVCTERREAQRRFREDQDSVTFERFHHSPYAQPSRIAPQEPDIPFTL
jgi:hypothetical protein